MFVKCYICNKINNNPSDVILCNRCSTNPYSVEDLRDQLAIKKQDQLFMDTYSLKYSEIKNLNTETFWDKIFEQTTFCKDQDPMTLEKIEQVISYIPKNTMRLLDVGIGQGYVEERLKKLNLDFELYGVDISKESVKKVKNNFKGIFLLDDVHNIDKQFKKNYFDAVIALELIEHIPASKIFSLLRKIHSLLNKNGTFIISTPLNEDLRNMKDNPNGHVRNYTIPILETELELSGFKTLDTRTFFAFKDFYLIKKLFAKILKNRWKPNNVVIKAIKD